MWTHIYDTIFIPIAVCTSCPYQPQKDHQRNNAIEQQFSSHLNSFDSWFDHQTPRLSCASRSDDIYLSHVA